MEELATVNVTDEGLKKLSQIRTLRVLHVSGIFTDDGLRHLSDMRNLEELYILWNRNMTDEGLRHLSHCTNLRVLKMLTKDEWTALESKAA